MKIERVGKLLFAYQTDVYFQVHQHALKTIIKLENKYIPLFVCRQSIQNNNPIFTLSPDERIWTEAQFYPPIINGNNERKD
jgi:hypothetical protein